MWLQRSNPALRHSGICHAISELWLLCTSDYFWRWVQTFTLLTQWANSLSQHVLISFYRGIVLLQIRLSTIHNPWAWLWELRIGWYAILVRYSYRHSNRAECVPAFRGSFCKIPQAWFQRTLCPDSQRDILSCHKICMRIHILVQNIYSASDRDQNLPRNRD